MLDTIVRTQLHDLARAYQLPALQVRRLASAYNVLTRASLNQPPTPPFGGLSHINRNGLPFQWSFCMDGHAPTVRFVCETGTPGTSPQSRLQESLDRFDEVCLLLKIPAPGWLREDVLAQVLPDDRSWPEHWRSALWFAVGAGQNGIALKVYLNLDRDEPLKRWRRIGWVLKALGRDMALEKLCDLSGQVSHGSTPLGIAVDVLPDGRAGRVKIYFGSDAVDVAWLQRWYEACGACEASGHFDDMNRLLQLFPYPHGTIYPVWAFFVGLEFSATSAISLKTDVSLSRWATSDAEVTQRTRQLLGFLGLDEAPYLTGLGAIGSDPTGAGPCTIHQLVGLGFEPDGACHVNVYCAPPLPLGAGGTV